MRKKIVRIEGVVGHGYVVRAKVGAKEVCLTPSRGAWQGYASVDSAQRAWRKLAEKRSIGNYKYELVLA